MYHSGVSNQLMCGRSELNPSQSATYIAVDKYLLSASLDKLIIITWIWIKSNCTKCNDIL